MTSPLLTPQKRTIEDVKDGDDETPEADPSQGLQKRRRSEQPATLPSTARPSASESVNCAGTALESKSTGVATVSPLPCTENETKAADLPTVTEESSITRLPDIRNELQVPQQPIDHDAITLASINSPSTEESHTGTEEAPAEQIRAFHPKDVLESSRKTFASNKTDTVLCAVVMSVVVFASVDVLSQIGTQATAGLELPTSSLEYDSHQTLRMVKFGLIYGLLGYFFYKHLDSIFKYFDALIPTAATPLFGVMLKVAVEHAAWVRILLKMSRFLGVGEPFFPSPIASQSSMIVACLVVVAQCMNFSLISPEYHILFCLLMTFCPLSAVHLFVTQSLKVLSWLNESTSLGLELASLAVLSGLAFIIALFFLKVVFNSVCRLKLHLWNRDASEEGQETFQGDISVEYVADSVLDASVDEGIDCSTTPDTSEEDQEVYKTVEDDADETEHPKADADELKDASADGTPDSEPDQPGRKYTTSEPSEEDKEGSVGKYTKTVPTDGCSLKTPKSKRKRKRKCKSEPTMENLAYILFMYPMETGVDHSDYFDVKPSRLRKRFFECNPSFWENFYKRESDGMWVPKDGYKQELLRRNFNGQAAVDGG